jgi:hypothetical protein
MWPGKTSAMVPVSKHLASLATEKTRDLSKLLRLGAQFFDEDAMSGSAESNEDLVAGRVNRSNDQTTIWAENKFTTVDIGPFEVDWFRTEFGGPVIFLAEVAKNSENEEGEFRPSTPLDGIMGVGWSAEHAGQSGGTGVVGVGGAVGGRGVFGKGGEGGPGVVGDAGGAATGIMGLGGPRSGTGVFGLGSGGDRLLRHGRGGTGVHGVGGDALLQPGPDDVPPGVGVFGQGGRVLESNPDRVLLGTGVVGVGGDAGNKDMPDASNAGSAGVFGQGADAKINTIVDGGMTTSEGPAEPGAGVIGRGGVVTGDRLPPAAGVIGLAGGHDKSSIWETGNTGVFGRGPTGVRGIGISGHGIRGQSDTDRGGVFSSDEVAQMQLIPKRIETRFPEGTSVTPVGMSGSALQQGVVSLPKNGQGGDLMALVDDSRICTLWFCVRSGDASSPARWAQVLMGPSFDGQA